MDKYWKLVDEIREVEPKYATDEWSYPDPFGPGYNSQKDCYNYWKKVENEKRVRKERELAQKRFNDYWESHSEEKKQYEDRLSAISDEIAEIKHTLLPYENNIKGFEAEKSYKVPAEAEVAAIQQNINELMQQKNSLGLFQGKAKKALQEQIDALTVNKQNAENTVRYQKDAQRKDIDEKIVTMRAEMKPYQDKIIELEKEKATISTELTKAR